MKMRVLVGGMHHESDTFNPIITGKNDIWVLRGKELLEIQDTSSLSGVISTLKNAGYEVIPALLARAVPNGEWDKDYYLTLKAEFLEAIKQVLPLDALCLSLHGSMRVKDIGEAEGDLLEDIRKICPSIPIISSLDMHATISPRMLFHADGYVGYKCAPHTDTYETGVHAANITINTDVMGIDVIVTDKHVGCYDPEMMRVLGVEPQDLKAIVVKLGYLEPEIRAIAKKSILVLTDGSTNEVFTRLEYKHLPRPMYPFDQDMEWEP